MPRARPLAFLAAALLATLPSSSQSQQADARRRPTESFTVGGRVVDATTRQGIADAEVIGTSAPSTDSARTRTDADGRWSLTLPVRGAVSVRARMLGYDSRTVVVPDERALDQTVIALRPVPLSLDAVVVSAARREQRLADAVLTTELIGRREIRESGASDLAGVLVETTGVQLEGGVPVGAGVQLQGFGERRVLLLVDGQPLVGRVNGNFDVSRLPASIVERIEVVKGPQSTLFGSEAVGGVINIVTRAPAPAPIAAAMRVVGGSLGRRDATGTLSGTIGGVGYVADGGYRHVDLAPGIRSETSTLARRWDAHVKLRSEVGGVAVEGSALAVVEDQRYRTGQRYQFGDNEQWSARVGATWESRGRRHRFAPLLYYTRFDHRARASATPRPDGEGERDVQQLLELELAYSGELHGAALDAGVELRRERITADRVEGGTRSLDAAEPFAQLTLTRGHWSVQPGLRVSWSEAWGESVTPRVAALYRPAPRLALRASLGRGFRAPDFKELYIDFVHAAAGYAVRGNPELRPESSVNGSAGVEWAGSSVYARATVFHNRFSDFIETRETESPGTFSYGNVASGRTQGIELDAGLVAGRARLEGGYAYLRSRDDATGRSLLGPAPHSARLAAGYQIASGLRAKLTGLFTGAAPTRRDASGAVTSERDDFLRFDLNVQQQLPRALALTFGVDNLLDEEPGADWPGFAGRMIYVGLTWQSSSALQ